MSSTSSVVSSVIAPSIFSGTLAERSYLALSLICVEQFVAVFAPGVAYFLSFIQALLFPEGMSSSVSEIYDDDTITIDEETKGQPPAPTVLSTYSRFMDDKRPTIGTKSDLDKLKAFGYDKYRYLSKSFLKRNHLLQKKEAKKQRDDNDG